MCNQMNLETLGFGPIMLKNLSIRCLPPNFLNHMKLPHMEVRWHRFYLISFTLVPFGVTNGRIFCRRGCHFPPHMAPSQLSQLHETPSHGGGINLFIFGSSSGSCHLEFQTRPVVYCYGCHFSPHVPRLVLWGFGLTISNGGGGIVKTCSL